MSTRATVHFKNDDGTTAAIVYRHSDGHPKGLGNELQRFLNTVASLSDPRFDDASYLAAKWIVFDSRLHVRSENPLNFLSVGVVLSDPMDIEYRYYVLCNGKRPQVTHEKIY